MKDLHNRITLFYSLILDTVTQIKGVKTKRPRRVSFTSSEDLWNSNESTEVSLDR